MKPFMVMDISDPSKGAPIFATTVANAKILVASSSTTPEAGAEQSPYRWNYGEDQTASVPLAAAFAGRSLSGKTASFAGDKALTSKKRVFGAIYPQNLVDIAAFEKQLKENGGTLAKAVAFDPADPTKTTEALPTLVLQLKDAGVTSVIVFADPATFAPMLKAATNQQYSPEWIITGFGYTDFDVFGRGFDQEQMKHAFGIGSLSPFSAPEPGGVTERSLGAFNWYWGDTTTKTNDGGFVNPFVYNALALRGPDVDGREREEGPVRGARPHQWDGGELLRLRQHGRHAVPRVRALRVRQCVDLVEPHRERAGQRRRDPRHGQVHVPLGRRALRLHELPQVRAQVLRHQRFGRPRPAGVQVPG